MDDSGSARLLAVRDEDPEREWDALGPWWPERYPGVIGIRDRRAGGAWLAASPDQGRLAVLLNRADVTELGGSVESRGSLALESVVGRSPVAPLPMHGFNLLEVDRAGARVFSWDGRDLTETPVGPGTHMIAHDDLDDTATPRIATWLPRFRALGPAAADRADWSDEWVSLLAESATLSPEDDRAIIRDNRPHGYPTQSLLYCVATVTGGGVQVRDHPLPAPGHWTA